MKNASRYFAIVTYCEHTQLCDILEKKSSQIRSYAFITHDKDITEDGELKVSHKHLIIALYQQRTLDDILKWFSGLADENGLRINTMAIARSRTQIKEDYLYLTHKNAEEKYQYSEEDITQYNQELFISKNDIQEDTIILALDDLLNGESLQKVYRRYGRDFIIHYNSIRKLYLDIKDGEIYATDEQ